MSSGEAAPASRSLRKRLFAIITCSHFPEKSSEKKGASKGTGVPGAHGKEKASEVLTSRKSTAPVGAVPQQAKAGTVSPPSAKIANYEPPAPQIRRGGSVAAASRNSISSASTTKRASNAKSHSAPVSGELGGPSLKKSTSKSLSKLRDHYVGVMMRLGDMSNSVNLGNSVTFESQVFESEGIRKQSQVENEIMEFYLHSSIQPGEWKDARMGSRINRNSSITA